MSLDKVTNKSFIILSGKKITNTIVTSHLLPVIKQDDIIWQVLFYNLPGGLLLVFALCF
jgi:hypothetical protein